MIVIICKVASTKIESIKLENPDNSYNISNKIKFDLKITNFYCIVNFIRAFVQDVA